MIVSFPMLRHLSAALGKTDDRLNLASLGSLHFTTIEKTLFSMATPEFLSVLHERSLESLVLMGIEVCQFLTILFSGLIGCPEKYHQSHVCVLQSTLDLLERGYDVHVLADGVSSCNKEEVPWALERMRQAGAQITTSESILFQLQGNTFFLGVRTIFNRALE